jgi:hypothetical protein
MALYIPHSIFHLARLLYVRPETFGSYYVGHSTDLYRLLVTCDDGRRYRPSAVKVYRPFSVAV